ncbi:MAG TPA: AAA family ATPase [Terracidiphilus sp.]|nr:AAA family ATPase [Terracidiphilus sp.]
MYRSFFGLRDHPFGSSPDPRFLYMTPQVRESLACLQYGMAARKGFVVMTGPVGTGKTTLLRTVLDSFVKERVSAAFVFNPRLDVLDFFEYVLTDFGIPPQTRTKSGMLLQLNQWLCTRYHQGGLCVIVIDEAQHLSVEMLEEIRLLTNLENSSDKLVQIALSGQTELLDTLRNPALRQLRQRVALWCRTHPLTADDVDAYIAQRVRIAGAAGSLFSPEAVSLIHLYSRGIPRNINLLCEHALIEAFVEQIAPVPPHVIDSVASELGLYDFSPGYADGSISQLQQKYSVPELQIVESSGDGVDLVKEHES